MCTGSTLSYQPCNHQTIHHSTKCSDPTCLQARYFPITYVNGFCAECMGSNNNSQSNSIHTVESEAEHVSNDVKAIGNKLHTLIQSYETISSAVDSEVRCRLPSTRPERHIRFEQDLRRQPTSGGLAVDDTSTLASRWKPTDVFTPAFTQIITLLQHIIDKSLVSWRNGLDEAVDRQMAGSTNVKSVKDCLRASHRWLDEQCCMGFQDAEERITLQCREILYQVGVLMVVAGCMGFLLGVWYAGKS